MAIEPIKGFYVHDEVTDTDGVAKYDYNSLLNTPAFDEEIGVAQSELFTVESEVSVYATSNGWRLNGEDGLCSSNANYKMVKFRVFAGNLLKIVSDDKFQFQTSPTVNVSGTVYRVGNTYGIGTYYLTVPENATYLIISSPINSSNAKAYVCGSIIDNIETGLTNTNNKIDVLRNDVNTITGVEKITYQIGKYVGTTNPLTLEDGVPVPTGTSSAWKCAIIPCSEGDVFTINGASNNHALRGWFFAKSDGYYISESANPFDVSDNLALVAPANSAWLILNSNALARESYVGNTIDAKFSEVWDSLETRYEESDYNDTLLFDAFPKHVNPIEITDKTYVSLQIASGGVVQNSTQRKSVICKIVPNTYISVKKIQTRFAWIGFSTEYPKNGTVLNEHFDKNGANNTEIGLQSGSNDNYMIFMYYDSTYDDSETAIQNSMHIYYDCAEFSQFDMIAHADNHLVNLLKYRPVGKVQKPYIAISCDDGNAVLATYTIPRIQYWKQTYGIDIPVTFALFDTSAVMLNATYKDLVIDACENYGGAVAIHGVHSFFNYQTRKELMAYINKQNSYLTDELGVSPNAVIYPEHDYNDFIQTFCGSFYNACGCGGNNHNLAYEDDHGRPFYIGEKSNCYEIYRLAIHDTRITSLEDVEAIVDYAYDHNYIICPYFHDVDLGDDAPNKDFLRAVLDKFVSYGISKGIDFIQLGDIPYVL